MKLFIELNLDSDAMQGARAVSDIIIEAGHGFHSYDLADSDEGSLRDDNGNTVLFWRVEGESNPVCPKCGRNEVDCASVHSGKCK